MSNHLHVHVHRKAKDADPTKVDVGMVEEGELGVRQCGDLLAELSRATQQVQQARSLLLESVRLYKSGDARSGAVKYGAAENILGSLKVDLDLN